MPVPEPPNMNNDPAYIANIVESMHMLEQMQHMPEEDVVRIVSKMKELLSNEAETFFQDESRSCMSTIEKWAHFDEIWTSQRADGAKEIIKKPLSQYCGHQGKG